MIPISKDNGWDALKAKFDRAVEDSPEDTDSLWEIIEQLLAGVQQANYVLADVINAPSEMLPVRDVHIGLFHMQRDGNRSDDERRVVGWARMMITPMLFTYYRNLHPNLDALLISLEDA